MTSSGKDMAAPSEPGPTVPRDLQMIATVRGLSRAAVRILAWASPRPLGTLFTASEGSGSIRAITPTGGVSVVTTVSGGAEMLSFVPLNLGSSGNPVGGLLCLRLPERRGDGRRKPVRRSARRSGGDQRIQPHGHRHHLGPCPVVSRVLPSTARGWDHRDRCADPPPAVPEPETWSLLLLGLAMLGLGFRRARYVRGLKAI